MKDDILDSVALMNCGHSINLYNGFGVCEKCHTKNCWKCLQIKDDLLLCPRCFLREVTRNG